MDVGVGFITEQWLPKVKNYVIKLSRNLNINTLVYADDQFLLSDSEDNLQRSIKKLEDIVKEYGMKITPQKENQWPSKERK